MQTADEVIYSSNYGFLEIDVAKRKATCRACHLPILKGERRVSISFRMLRNVKKTAAGGVITEIRHFLHADCVANAIDAGSYKRRCICGNVAVAKRWAKTNSQKVTLWGTDGAHLFPLCRSCANTRFEMCEICHHYHTKFNIAHVEPQEAWNKVVSIICEPCANQAGIETPRTKRERLQSELILEAEQAQIRMALRNGVLD